MLKLILKESYGLIKPRKNFKIPKMYENNALEPFYVFFCVIFLNCRNSSKKTYSTPAFKAQSQSSLASFFQPISLEHDFMACLATFSSIFG